MGKDLIEDIVEAPARALDKSITSSSNFRKRVMDQKPIKSAEKYWELLGPGLVTGASDDDPSGIATYSQTGAKYGFGLLWLSVVTFPLMAVIQEMCARIGLITGRGLASNIRKNFPNYVIYIAATLLFVANTFNLGADLGAMAKAVQLLYPNFPFPYLIIGFTLLTLFLQIFAPYEKYSKYLKWMALVLLSYVFAVLVIKDVNWGEILRSAIRPQLEFSKDQFILICAILGTTISPYLFFWQTSQEVEELTEKKMVVSSKKEPVSQSIIKDMRTDVWSGMFLSNLVMFFIIVACAITLNKAGLTNVQTAEDAARALRPLAGDMSYLLFAVGIIGVGLLGIPVLSGSAAYAISESLRWREGLHKKLNHAYSFYGVMIFSMAIGLGLNFVGLDSIKALIYSAVLNGLVAPVVLVLIVLLSSNKKIMGDYANSGILKTVGWITVGLMVVAAVATIYSIFS
jgi:NRAMP (natural resistance-associated macrophage protein)-like metal ion transporter